MELEKAIERIKEIKIEYGKMDGLKEYVEAIETILEELEKKDKIIDEMVKKIDSYYDEGYNYELFCQYEPETCNNRDCKQCIKQYFENKVEEAE